MEIMFLSFEMDYLLRKGCDHKMGWKKGYFGYFCRFLVTKVNLRLADLKNKSMYTMNEDI